MLERDEFSVACRAEPHALLGARPVTDRLEHHLTAEHELHRLAQLPRRCGRKRAVCPWKQFAAETRANELCDDPDVLLRQIEHLREYAPKVDDSLR